MSASTSHTVYVKGRPVTAKATSNGDVSLRIGSLDGIGKGEPGGQHAAVVMSRDEAEAISRAVLAATDDAVCPETRPAPQTISVFPLPRGWVDIISFTHDKPVTFTF